MAVCMVPEGLEEMPPGPGLCALLADIDLRSVMNEDLPVVLRARARQLAYDEALLAECVHELGHRDPLGGPASTRRLPVPDRYAVDEIRLAMLWSHGKARAAFDFADLLIEKFPTVHRLWRLGRIDTAKTRALCQHLKDLPVADAKRVYRAVRPM